MISLIVFFAINTFLNVTMLYMHFLFGDILRYKTQTIWVESINIWVESKHIKTVYMCAFATLFKSHLKNDNEYYQIIVIFFRYLGLESLYVDVICCLHRFYNAELLLIYFKYSSL